MKPGEFHRDRPGEEVAGEVEGGEVAEPAQLRRDATRGAGSCEGENGERGDVAEVIGDGTGEREAGGVEGGEVGEVEDGIGSEAGEDETFAGEPVRSEASQVKLFDPIGPADDAGPGGAGIGLKAPVFGAHGERGAKFEERVALGLRQSRAGYIEEATEEEEEANQGEARRRLHVGTRES